jgi:hypothetical protein
LQTVIGSLHKKYGDPTADQDTVFPLGGKVLDSGPNRYVAVWIFDSQGHPFKFAKDTKSPCRFGEGRMVIASAFSA